MYGVKLTEEQDQAFALMSAFRMRTKKLEESRLVFILNGYAGTGKTTVVAEFVNQFPKGTMVCTPTHDAKEVLMGKIEAEVPFETIHAALGLKEQINGEKVEFVPSGFDKLDGVRLLVIDEFSMIGTKLLGYIMEASYKYHLPVIFVGDGAQLPPVGESFSPVCSQQFVADYEAEMFTLTKIVRQAEGNPIIQASMKVRDMSQATTYYDLMTLLSESESEGKGIYHAESIKPFLHRYTDMNSINQAKVLCYRNYVVDRHNKSVREYISPDIAKYKIAVGDSIILKKPLVDGNIVLLSNNTKAAVVGVTQVSKDVVGLEIPSYRVVIEPYSSGGSYVIHTPHESGISLYKALLDELRKIANDLPQKSALASNAWNDFRSVKRMFTDWQHGYAMTTHRSQGATFKHVLIDMKDIWSIQDPYTRNHLIYTAITRASDTVTIIW